MDPKILWPEGKQFAFTVFDDTDLATLENVKEVYSFLSECGFRTTKSVWPVRGQRETRAGGATCEDKAYLEWLLGLRRDGFEIGYHNATFHSSLRDETIRAIERFAELFNHYPQSMANHVGCEESIYWGNYRLTGLHEKIYNFLTRNRNKDKFRGHIEGDKYFWGDICKEKIKYVRNFVFSGINTIKICPVMPYHDPKRKYVNYWFASSDGANVKKFNNCISETNQDRLEKEGGACIMYAHFAFGFLKEEHIDSKFRFLMERLSKKNGWFVPVSTLLDYLLQLRNNHDITDRQRNTLERKWLFNKIKVGTT
jgi:hypothetical protein